ncbi:hypothetical protein J6590_040427 [Homalodisca vitripennis]|nr:hypothetical protein J6590_040427 [Homalodisca vitripennis]
MPIYRHCSTFMPGFIQSRHFQLVQGLQGVEAQSMEEPVTYDTYLLSLEQPLVSGWGTCLGDPSFYSIEVQNGTTTSTTVLSGLENSPLPYRWVRRLSQDNQIKQRRAWPLLGQVTAERSCPYKRSACPAIGGGSEVTCWSPG